MTSVTTFSQMCPEAAEMFPLHHQIYKTWVVIKRNICEFRVHIFINKSLIQIYQEKCFRLQIINKANVF